MTRPDPAQLAAALRENLRRRKDQVREPVESGTDEEGDAAVPEEGAKSGAWVSEGSKKL